MGDKKLGAIELKPKRKFYDYQAKYDSKAKTKHIVLATFQDLLQYLKLTKLESPVNCLKT